VANSGAPNFSLTVPGSATGAIEISNSSSFTLNNQANAQIIGGRYGIYSVHIQINAPFRVTNSGTIDAQGPNSSGIFFLSTEIPGTNSFITNENGGTIKGVRDGIYVQNDQSRSYSNFTITNKGSIVGTSRYGINLDANTNNATISNHGTISGNTSAIFFGGTGNTLNIHDGAVFTNGVDFNSKTGNTLNFYTGSYTLGVKNYLVASNTINLRGTGTQAITSGLNGVGTGNIVVVAPQVAAVTPSVTNTVASSVSNVVSSVVTSAATTIVPPVQGFTPEPPAPGSESNSFGNDFTAKDVAAPENNPRTSVQVYTLANLNPTVNPDILKLKQGQKVDAYGNLAWARGFGSLRELPSTARVVGYSNWLAGMMFGYDRNLDGWRLGLYGGYAYGSTSMKDSSGSLNTDYYLGGVYARRKFGEYTVLANLSGGILANRMSRSINLGAETAKASFDGGFIAPELSVSRDYAVAPGWVVTPTLRGRYVGAFLPSYREAGSSQNIAYGSSASHAVEERLEVKLARNFTSSEGLNSAVYVQAAAIGSHRIGGDSLNASLLGTNFIIRNQSERNTAGALIGVGFDYQMSKQVTAFGGVDATYQTDKTRSVIGRIGAKMAF
jgi:hypothetical protein